MGSVRAGGGEVQEMSESTDDDWNWCPMWCGHPGNTEIDRLTAQLAERDAEIERLSAENAQLRKAAKNFISAWDHSPPVDMMVEIDACADQFREALSSIPPASDTSPDLRR